MEGFGEVVGWFGVFIFGLEEVGIGLGLEV